MPTYLYIASTAQGDSVRGTLPAADRAEVVQRLREQGLFLVSCRSQEAAAVAVSEAPPSKQAVPVTKEASARVPGSAPPRGKISPQELAVLTRQISISVRAGISFVNTFQRMSQRARNPKTAYVLRRILEDVLAGRKFSDALAEHPSVFPPLYVSMVAAGEAGGFMPDALNRVAGFLDKEIDLNAKVRSAMVYPVTIVFVATVVVTGVMLFVVPTFVRIFHEMNVPLPWPTRMLLSASTFFRHGGFLLPFGLIGLFAGIKALRRRHERFRAFWDEKILGAPLFGRLITLEVTTRFIRTLASLVDNGVAALEAIGISRHVVQNRAIENVIDRLYASVQQGQGLSPVLYASPHFPELVADMVATGESTGTLPEVLNRTADYYDAEVSSAVRDLVTLIEPLMIMVMAVIVGVIIAGLMLPLIGISGAIGA